MSEQDRSFTSFQEAVDATKPGIGEDDPFAYRRDRKPLPPEVRFVPRYEKKKGKSLGSYSF